MAGYEFSSREHELHVVLRSGRLTELVRYKAVHGELRHSYLRALYWKLLLGVVAGDNAVEQWPQQLQAARERYTKLSDKHLVDPHANDDDVDAEVHNPLSTAEDSPWQKYFENSHLEKEIWQDVDRTFPEVEFFRDDNIRQMMLRLLLIHSKEYDGIGYRQGMHELLATIVYVLHTQTAAPKATKKSKGGDDGSAATTATEQETQLLDMALDERYLEADAYALFENLMAVVGQWYSTGADVLSPRPRKHGGEAGGGGGVDERLGALGAAALPGGTEKAKAAARAEAMAEARRRRHAEQQLNAVVIKSNEIQGTLLRKLDPELASYLEALSVQPQLYALRWLRLLFGREFHLEDTIVVWDALFAYGDGSHQLKKSKKKSASSTAAATAAAASAAPKLGPPTQFLLVDYFAVAMLLYIREQLLEFDLGRLLQRLKTFPPVEDVSNLVALAVQHHTNPQPIVPRALGASGDVGGRADGSRGVGGGARTAAAAAAAARPSSKRRMTGSSGG
eukprot:CAMPEP_0198324390 /NCGR_PEP_ID=MMETSP1450-20131203/12417_1 /TAXON_ID=753684 ORGANISM="Madagascaria erythrocladiodes, Strain CCMP3234" /NCGR_SAMPLE_ID=MMETSP1450 /ASSEMBLY_ACC=CAM_ASM_001115 /LENGTH=506 /DNA_ID=CAMNT_0044028185 /DNA_START=88 /DNA_END=1604 /DNA_ORIENTATION=-